MLIAPPKGSYELKIYKEWLQRYNIDHSILTGEITNIDQPLLLCGGVDVGVNKVRDQLELNWIQSAIENKQPIIGICRGMQILNQYFENKSIENISELLAKNHFSDRFDDDNDHSHRTSKFHTVNDIYGNTMIVNSRHNQHCRWVALNFDITHRAEDGTVEGIVDYKRNIWAVQWHPERNECDNNLYPLNMIYHMKQNTNNL